MVNDQDLLREFTQTRSDTAFRTLVERHAAMVQGTALRVVGNTHRAEEVTQAVFILLARKASDLRRGTCVAGWLYRTARLIGLETVRAQSRREKWHKAYGDMNETTDGESVWRQIAPFLDEALAELRAADRDALVLRFLDEQSFAQLAESMRISEAAAKMRVNRALDKLRTAFGQRGMTISGTLLLTALSAPAVLASPPIASTATLTSVALEGTTSGSIAALLNAFSRSLLVIRIKAGAVGFAVLLAVVSLVTFVVRLRAPENANGSPVRTFAPLAGQWKGTIQMQANGEKSTTPAPVELSIRSAVGSRQCEIEMRVETGAGRLPILYHFTHELNETGNRINTEDDPQIGRSDGDGFVTESRQDDKTGDWRLAFHTLHQNDSGFSQCEWNYGGNLLTISRRDSQQLKPGPLDISTVLKLKRVREML